MNQQTVQEERRGGARPRVLIVEDEADIRELMRYNLEREGFLVEEAGDGAPAGLQLVEHLHGDGTEIFLHACQLGCEGHRVQVAWVAVRLRPRCDAWIKVKNPAAPAVKREAEEAWGKPR